GVAAGATLGARDATARGPGRGGVRPRRSPARRTVPLLRRRDRRRVDALAVRHVEGAVRLTRGFRHPRRRTAGEIRRHRAAEPGPTRATRRTAAAPLPGPLPRRPRSGGGA